MGVTMSYDLYSSELLFRGRVSSKYQEAEADRLANTVRRNSPIHHTMLNSVGRAFRVVTQVVQAVIYHKNRRFHVPRQ